MTSYEWLAYCDELELFEAGIVDVPAVIEPGDRVTFLDAGKAKSGRVLANTGSGSYIKPDNQDSEGAMIRAAISSDGNGGSAIVAQEHVELPVLHEAATYIERLGPREPGGSRSFGMTGIDMPRFMDAYLVAAHTIDAPPVGVVRKDRNVWKIMLFRRPRGPASERGLRDPQGGCGSPTRTRRR